MSLSVLGKAVTLELKRDAQSDNRQPCLDQDADVTSAPDPLSNPQSRRTPTEVHQRAYRTGIQADIDASLSRAEGK